MDQSQGWIIVCVASILIGVALGGGIMWGRISMQRYDHDRKSQFIRWHVETLRIVGVSDNEIRDYVDGCKDRNDYFDMYPNDLIMKHVAYVKEHEGDAGVVRIIHALLDDNKHPLI